MLFPRENGPRVPGKQGCHMPAGTPRTARLLFPTPRTATCIFTLSKQAHMGSASRRVLRSPEGSPAAQGRHWGLRIDKPALGGSSRVEGEQALGQGLSSQDWRRAGCGEQISLVQVRQVQPRVAWRVSGGPLLLPGLPKADRLTNVQQNSCVPSMETRSGRGLSLRQGERPHLSGTARQVLSCSSGRDRHRHGSSLTSVGTLGVAGTTPFSELTFPELLLGELGPEPGALLQAESAEGERAA